MGKVGMRFRYGSGKKRIVCGSQARGGRTGNGLAKPGKQAIASGGPTMGWQ